MIIMVSSGDFRRGTLFEMDGALYVVVEFQHVKQSRVTFIRTKLKNILTGQNIDKTFGNTEKFNEVFIETKQMQYLYRDGDLFYFMDGETYEQICVDKETIGDTVNYLKENESVTFKLHKDKVIMVESPIFVNLEIVETEPPVQSEGVKTKYKPAKLETGLIVQVPLFVNAGEIIIVDTRTGEYSSRV